MNKSGYVLSLDAFLALILVFGILFFIKPDLSQMSFDSNIQDDLLEVLSSLKISEIDNVYVKELIDNGTIKNLNNSILEQIGEFYSSSSPYTSILIDEVIGDIGLDENFGLYFNNVPVFISSNIGFDNSSDVKVSRQIISGIHEGNSSRGFSSRAFLSSSNKVDYFYFGGYIGDGNITVNLGEDVREVNIEGVFSRDFDLYLNGVFIDRYFPTPDIPYSITMESYSNLFSSGMNYLEFKDVEDLYIAGGYVRVAYNDSAVLSSNKTRYLPGIEGVINFYDSFYIPGSLASMDIFLHYYSDYDIFLNIGDEQIYEGNSSGNDLNITISNSQISNFLNYSSLDFSTIPFRLGLENVTYISNYSIDADVFSVTDLSGSMASGCSGGDFWCCIFSSDGCNSESTCGSCSGVWEDKMILAKEANKVFINSVLNDSDNRVGLVGYRDVVYPEDVHNLSSDNVSLSNKVDSWVANGATCICCGINEAVGKLVENSESSDFRSVVVMSDGEANRECSFQGTGDAKQDAINAACDAYNDYGIIVYAIGFGSDTDESTLQSIASCGMGNYYYGDVAQLTDVYEQVADDILNAAYYEQTVVSDGIYTKLYPDSYISFNYERELPYGMLMDLETDEFMTNDSSGGFFVPNDTQVYEAKVVSYSGSRWTDKVDFFNDSSSEWESFFDLGNYDSSYINLGDPYVVNIPLEKIKEGNNSFRVFVGLNPDNSSGGSIYNKIIYSLVKDISSYSPIVSCADGCNWVVEFEDGSNSTIVFPEDYVGDKECFFTSSLVAYNNNDAIDNAIYNLFLDLDLNSNGMIETKFSERDLKVNSIEVEGIPFTWETEAQVRVWK